MKLNRSFVACAGLCCGLLAGCMSPGVTKMAKQPPKPSQDEFSCGELTPPRKQAVQLQQSYQAGATAQAARGE